MAPQNNIRNFVIISHIDHGKSTLSDRFLEITNTVQKREMHPQYLDMMSLEREKGITIKMQPVRMNYVFDSQPYVLNLIDTPGHIDFTYEVSRSLAAAEGAVLLVDATKGVQAQTISNLDLAKKQGLVIIPAINKIDIEQARTEEVSEEIVNLFGVSKEEIIRISAKQGTNCEFILQEIIKKVPPPAGELAKPFRALIFDSEFDSYKGVIVYLRVVDGEVSQGDKIFLAKNKVFGLVKEVGYFKPNFSPTKKLQSGEIGYLATGVKEPEKVKVGDTVVKRQKDGQFPQALPGYYEPKPVVFTSVFCQNPDDFDLLKEAVYKLKLNDSSLVFEEESKSILGRGFRFGFLGQLHAEIIIERLHREFNLELVVSFPSVAYKVIKRSGQEIMTSAPKDYPDSSQIQETLEQYVEIEVITPVEFIGQVYTLLEARSARHIQTKYLGAERAVLVYEVPLREIMVGFYDQLKGSTKGYASMSYRILGYKPSRLVKMEILILGKTEEAFTRIIPQDKAYPEAKKMVSAIKELLPSQLFSVPIQAVVDSRIIARETLKARRKDVTAPLYGGDVTRKRKLLERQKKGKKELKEKADIRIPPQVFLEIFKMK